MKVYLIEQSANSDYDTYDSAVVAAPNRAVARNMDPANGKLVDWSQKKSLLYHWCSSPKDVSVTYIGKTEAFENPTVICASFNAG